MWLIGKESKDISLAACAAQLTDTRTKWSTVWLCACSNHKERRSRTSSLHRLSLRKSMLGLLHRLSTWRYPHCCRAPAPAAIGQYLQQTSALSSKPAGRRYCCRSMGQTDGRLTRYIVGCSVNSSFILFCSSDQQAEAVAIHTELDRKDTEHRQLPIMLDCIQLHSAIRALGLRLSFPARVKISGASYFAAARWSYREWVFHNVDH